MENQQEIFRRPEEKQTYDSKPTIKAEVQQVNSVHGNLLANSSEEKYNIKNNSERFEKLVAKSKRVLLRISAVFPFQLFPDHIILDESKVNIIHRQFFLIKQIQSIPIQHIQDVEVDTAIFFATLKILPMGFSVVGFDENWVKVEYLWRNDAIRARRIIEGLLIGIREGIDFSKVETKQFVQKIETLGKVH